MLDREIEYLRSRPVFSKVKDSNDALALTAGLFKCILDKESLKDFKDFKAVVELYEKGYILIVSDEENDRVSIRLCDPKDAPQLQ